MFRFAPLAALAAVVAVAGFAIGAPSPGGSTDSSITISNLDSCTEWQAKVRKRVGGQPTGPTTTVIQSTTGCAPPPTETNPPPPPPGGSCDRTLNPGGNLTSFVGSLQSGETGCLSSGSYSAGSLSINRTNVTLTSAGARAEIRVADINLYGAGDTLRNLKIVSTSDANSGLRGTDQVIENNEITNNHGGASCLYLDAVRPIVRRNVIHDCGDPAEGNKNHGIYVDQATGGQITDNTFYAIQAYGLQLYPSPSGVLVANNTFDSPPTIRGGIVAYGSGNTVRDNIVAYAGVVEDEGNNTLSGNCVTGNPMFVNRAARDYRLQPSSPCAGKGVRP